MTLVWAASHRQLQLLSTRHCFKLLVTSVSPSHSLVTTSSFIVSKDPFSGPIVQPVSSWCLATWPARLHFSLSISYRIGFVLLQFFAQSIPQFPCTTTSTTSTQSSCRTVSGISLDYCILQVLPTVREWWACPRQLNVNHGGLRACAYFLRRTAKPW